MKTIAGRECSFYYADFHRGRNRQECRLLARNTASPRWEPKDCMSCRVPDILWANASEHLELTGEVKIGLLGFGRRVEIRAWCTQHDIPITDPFVGCERCADERLDPSTFFEENS